MGNAEENVSEYKGVQIVKDDKLIRIFKDIHDNSSDLKVCFVLGAGVSRSSGIRTGGELAKIWFEELKKDLTEKEFEDWVQNEDIDLSNPATSYCQIYEKRFESAPELGYDFVNEEMSGKEPGFGHSVMVKLLAHKNHNIVITTNFDNLLEKALYTFTKLEPMVISHESLAIYARMSDKRPLIAKIHRDKNFEPQSDITSTSFLDEKWIDPLNGLLSNKVVIVIGYGGNDGSLMGLLNRVAPHDKLYWCIRSENEVTKSILKLVKKKGGKFVTIIGFDHLMLKMEAELPSILKPNNLYDQMISTANFRANQYFENLSELVDQIKSSQDEESKKNLSKFIKNAGKQWLSYALAAEIIDNLVEKENIYNEGLNDYPNSPLNGIYAYFLHFVKQDFFLAEKYYKRTLKSDLDSSYIYGSYALFLDKIQKNFDEAEKYYKKALELDSHKAISNGNYALFLHENRSQYDEAEKFYKKALELDPNNSNNCGNYALFLSNIRKSYEEAEKYFKKSLELDPNQANNNVNYAIFLKDIRKDNDDAEKYFKKSLSLDPNNAFHIGNYANFLKDIRENYDEAEKYYKKALELDENNANNNCNYANFLYSIREKYDEAEKYYKKALELDPTIFDSNNNYGVFLYNIRKEYDEAEKYYKMALGLNPDNLAGILNYLELLCGMGQIEKGNLIFEKGFKLANDTNDLESLIILYYFQFAHFKEKLIEAKENLEHLLNKGVRRPNWSFDSYIQSMEKQNHPKLEELKYYARRINGMED